MMRSARQNLCLLLRADLLVSLLCVVLEMIGEISMGNLINASVIAGSLLLTATLVSAAPSVPKADDVVASIGDRKITKQEFDKKYAELKTQTLNPPPADLFLEDLVRYELGLQEAKKKHVEKDPRVAERINQEMYKGLVELAIADKVGAIKVEKKEMEAYYKDNPELRSSHILIEFRPDAKPEDKEAARKRAQELYEEVKTSKRSFEELAALYSDDALSKRNGGDVGWQTRTTLVPSYYNALMSMKMNEVKGLVETPYGFHIVKMTGKHSLSEANERAIRAAVFDQKRKVIFDEYFSGLKKNYVIKVNSNLVK